MAVKERKKRIYTSMFDQFHDLIVQGCDAGLTMREVYNTLPVGYTYSGLIAYIYKHEIRKGKWTTEMDNRPICNNCEHCQKFKNVMGYYNNCDNRICKLSWRVISNNVRHSPQWCERGARTNANANEGKHEDSERVN